MLNNPDNNIIISHYPADGNSGKWQFREMAIPIRNDTHLMIICRFGLTEK